MNRHPMTRFPSRFTAVVVMLLGLAVGCKGGGSGGDGGTQPSGTITINISPGSLVLTQGEDGSITVTLARAGGFSGSVTLSAQNLPSGVTIAGANIAAGATSAQLSVNPSSSATVGTTTVTIRATGSGVAAATATLSLAIQISVENGFDPSISISSVDIEQGASQAITIDVNRAGGFTGAVTFSANAPNGLTVSFDPMVVTGTQTTLTVEVDAGLAAGQYTITIIAEVDDGVAAPAAEGLAGQAAVVTKSLSLTVVVTQQGGGGGGGGGGGNVSVTFCAQSGVPLWVAVKDGQGGAWTRLTGTPGAIGTTYSFNVGSMGGIAWVTEDESGHTNLNMWFGDATFLQAFGSDLCVGNGLTKEVMGSVAGTNLGDQVTISMGGTSALAGPTGPNFTLPKVNHGLLVDLLAGLATFTGTGFLTSKLILRRGLDPLPGSTLLPLDFGAAEAFVPLTGAVTVNNFGTDFVTATSSFFSNRGPVGLLSQALGVGGGPLAFAGIPLPQRMPAELHLVTGSGASLGIPISSRTALVYVEDPTVAQILNLRSPLNTVTVSVVQTAPNVLLRAQVMRQGDYPDNVSFSAVQNGGTGRGFFAVMQSSYAGTTQVDFTVPDFSGVDGWNSNWGLVSGPDVVWSFAAFGHEWGGGVFAQPQDGDRSWTALQGGEIPE